LIDAHSDRLVGMPSGDTLPDGSFAFSNMELAMLRFAYGINDDVTLDMMLFPPWDRLFGNDDELPLFLDVAIRINVLRTEGFRAALLGSLMGGFDLERSRNNFYGLHFMATGQVCFDPTCHASVSVSGGVIFAWADFGSDESATIVGGGIGVIGRVSEHVSFIAEPGTVSVLEEDEAAISWFSYGIRLSGPTWGVDLTMVRPFLDERECGDGNPICIVGFPFVVVTYRTRPTETPLASFPVPTSGGPSPAPPSAGISSALGLLTGDLR
jgi:hypothetical protein